MDTATDDVIRTVEYERLRSLVQADLAVADRLHADDFQLVHPGGGVLTKEQYLSGIASGYLHYRAWEPDSDIAVRLYGDATVIRYRSQLHMSVGGADGELRHYWPTDSYEKRDGRWQVVWSQATLVQQPG